MDMLKTESSRLCFKCQTLQFYNISEVSSVHDVYPTWKFLNDQPGEPFRPEWVERHNIGTPYFLPIHSSFSELEQSAENGCHFCLQVFFSFSPEDVAKFKTTEGSGATTRKVWLEYREMTGWYEHGWPKYDIWCIRKVIYVSYDRTYKLLDLLPLGHPLTYNNGQILRRRDFRSLSPSNDHTGSKLNLDLALKWKEDCLENHAATCGSVLSASAPKLPKRVINVNSDPPSLHISNGECAPYAILSHSWGKNKMKPIRTTVHNLAERCRLIPWELLPKTYKDAIDATRGLKLGYLWIDSLCIIQKDKSGPDADNGSTKDWLEESLKMGDYYGNATVTVGAAYATDDTIGCFAKRNPLSLLPCDIRIKFPGKTQIEEFTSWLSDEIGPEDHWSLPHRRRAYAEAPLNRRVWCLQESTVSTRILNFEAEQMTWECLSSQANELSPDGQLFPGVYTYIPTLRNTIAKTRGAVIEHMSRSAPDSIWVAWLEMLEDLTQREIYTGWDLLPAISGLAKSIQQMQHLPEECYIAGIWETDLARSLLWATRTRNPKSEIQNLNNQPCRNGRNPSWSWASLDNGNISFKQQDSGVERNIEVFKVIKPLRIIPLPGSTRFGQISEACLYIKGLIKRAHVGDKDTRNTGYSDSWKLIRSQRKLDDLVTNKLIGYFAPDEVDIPTQDVWCLPLRVWTGKTQSQDRYVGLALTPTGHKNIDFGYDEYRRVGIVRDMSYKWLEDSSIDNLAII